MMATGVATVNLTIDKDMRTRMLMAYQEWAWSMNEDVQPIKKVKPETAYELCATVIACIIMCKSFLRLPNASIYP